MKKYCFVLAGGTGDCLLGFQCAHFIPDKTKQNLDIIIPARQEIFDQINYIFGQQYNLIHEKNEKYWDGDFLLKNTEYLDSLNVDYQNVYLIYPDRLFCGKYSFDYKKFNTHPQLIRSTRLLTNLWNPQKIIYLALNTTTPGYSYYDVKGLLLSLSKELPDYELRLPVVKKWANKDVYSFGDLTGLPDNVNIIENPNFEEEFVELSNSSCAITLDNGFAHHSFQMGIPRILLDSRMDRSGLPWVSRWKEDISESLPINIYPSLIAKMVKMMIEKPHSCLIPRMNLLEIVANNQNIDDVLLVKKF